MKKVGRIVRQAATLRQSRSHKQKPTTSSGDVLFSARGRQSSDGDMNAVVVMMVVVMVVIPAPITAVVVEMLLVLVVIEAVVVVMLVVLMLVKLVAIVMMFFGGRAFDREHQGAGSDERRHQAIGKNTSKHGTSPLLLNEADRLPRTGAS